MIFSMTGYGKVEHEINGKLIIIELKSLNGKQFEIVNRINPLFKKYEAEIRSILIKKLIRGSIDLSITIKHDGNAKPTSINQDLVKSYFKSLQEIGKDLNIDIFNNPNELLAAILRIPEVVSADTDIITDVDWPYIAEVLEQTADILIQHRAQEGSGLGNDIYQRIMNIKKLLQSVEPFELPRNERIKQRIFQSLEDSVGKEQIDLNRLEQEMIFYIEKNDISEEKQRLAAHCNYFEEMISKADQQGIGKKLGFILQEIGREINTLGSKANDATIQKIVVNMKDELEKAKEQSLNIL
jgi:uncharacterized protein (TIGR00255 family)